MDAAKAADFLGFIFAFHAVAQAQQGLHNAPRNGSASLPQAKALGFMGPRRWGSRDEGRKFAVGEG